jgi:hypothetical protein
MKNLIFFCTFFVSVGFCTSLIASETTTLEDVRTINNNQLGLTTTKSKWQGFNIKLSPSFFWKTVGIEFEYPINRHISVGLNFMAKLGRLDGLKVNRTMPNEDYLKNGFAAELVGKYYFKQEAPEGLYLQANVAYNNFFYQDGTTRPFSFYNHWRDQNGTQSKAFKAPQPFQFGLGVGYQVVLLPKHFIGNIMVGTLGNFGGENQFQFSIYLAPSLGYVF